VQGRLLDKKLSVRIEINCADTGRGLEITVDSEMGFEVLSEGAEPLVFSPQIDWNTFKQANIIDAF
jgi:hypothetical protein